MSEQLEHIQQLKQQIAAVVNAQLAKVDATLTLLEEGNTIPFIARYRKEVTGNLDEVAIHAIEQHYHYGMQLLNRKEEVQRLIEEQGKWDTSLQTAIQQATTLQQVEDIYRPYKQKKRTKAMVAIENGLEPLADWLLNPEDSTVSLQQKAQKFITDIVRSEEEAIAGAVEILAQRVSDNASYREFIRKYARYNARLTSQVKDEAKDAKRVYELYYDNTIPIKNLVEHRTLAINRGEKEGVLSVKLTVEEAPAIHYMAQRFIPKGIQDDKQHVIQLAIEEAYKRFIWPAIEREIRNEATDKADKQAIKVFGDNLQNLLLTPPLKNKIVLGFDPAFRTGCKLAVIDETGFVLHKAVIYPHEGVSAQKRQNAAKELADIIQQYHIDVIAIGNGTASRESESFVANVIRTYQLDVSYLVISEAGASVYSASEIARQEFPDFQVEERSAVSIARRLQDPLAELIKIDPKSIGVGQYQHDVSQKHLTEELDFVVNTTVNKVGVDVNTASVSLLQHVSGLTASTAQNLIALRHELGKFTNRQQIKHVKRLGPKTYEQAIGFLRVIGGDNPLDQTSIHPESYDIAHQLLSRANVQPTNLGQPTAIQSLEALNITQIASEFEVGNETLRDILNSLKNPLADIRDVGQAPLLRQDVLTIDDLALDMTLQGVVRNVVDFGVFVDIGLKNDGLIHISKLSSKRVSHPSDIVKVGDIVEVMIIDIQQDKQRVGLKLKQKLSSVSH